MENLSTKDFFNGIISYAVEHGTLRLFNPHDLNIRQDYQTPNSTKEDQAVIYMIETDDGQQLFVAMSKDGQKCAVSNDCLMAYELYWSADKPIGYDGVHLSADSATVQSAIGTVGFVTDAKHGSKYVTMATETTQHLPENNFTEELGRISAELQQKSAHSENTQKFQRSIDNITQISSVSNTIQRAYEVNEIKQNMALKANLIEELGRCEVQISYLTQKIENYKKEYRYLAYSEEQEVTALKAKKSEIRKNLQDFESPSQTDDEGR